MINVVLETKTNGVDDGINHDTQGIMSLCASPLARLKMLCIFSNTTTGITQRVGTALHSEAARRARRRDAPGASGEIKRPD